MDSTVGRIRTLHNEILKSTRTRPHSLRASSWDQSEGIRGGYTSAKQNFLPHKPGTTAVIDHEITTRRTDAAEPSRCRQTRRGYQAVQFLMSFLSFTCGLSDPSVSDAAPPRYPHVLRRKYRTLDC
jgi:hypothetical protein